MIRVGVSGWSFPQWKDTFYAGVPRARWLAHYAATLSTVEINYTFRRTMAETTADKWTATVGNGFRFAVKAHQRITHHARLADPEGTLPHFLDSTARLGENLGPVLFQLPPHLPRDDGRLEAFLDALPAELSPAFEFRHQSWMDPAVYALLGNAGAALVIAETDDDPAIESITAPFTYLRLRKSEYSAAELRTWADRIDGYGVDAWVYLKHESDSPAYAQALQDMLG